MTDEDFQGAKGGVDLNGDCQFGQSSGYLPGGCHEHWQDAVRPAHGFFALDDLCPVCHTLWWRQGRSRADLRGAVPGHGLRPADLPREPARHRSVFVGAGGEALPHGLSRTDSALDAGRCQRVARLAHLCRFRATSDRSGQGVVCERGLGAGFVEYGVCTRLHDHRPVSVGLSVGTLSYDQGGSEDAYAARSARQHSEFHPHLRWQTARCSCPT